MSSSSIWICDTAGRILGPMMPETLRDLIASGRIKEVHQVSSDGKHWLPLAYDSEISRLVGMASRSRGHHFQREKAAEIRSHLAGLKRRRAHQVFGVPHESSLEEYRAAFFRVVKPFHPDRIPANAAPELRDACAEMFSFLSTLMSEAEREVRARSAVDGRSAKPDRMVPNSHSVLSVSRSPSIPIIPRTMPKTPGRTAAAPNYGPEEFVGIQRGQYGMQATVRVNRKNVGIFTDHSLTNIGSEGVFLPTYCRLALGSLLDVRFIFENSARQIQARARVVWENIGSESKGSPGYGVRFVRLEKADQAFIQSFISQQSPAPAV